MGASILLLRNQQFTKQLRRGKIAVAPRGADRRPAWTAASVSMITNGIRDRRRPHDRPGRRCGVVSIILAMRMFEAVTATGPLDRPARRADIRDRLSPPGHPEWQWDARPMPTAQSNTDPRQRGSVGIGRRPPRTKRHARSTICCWPMRPSRIGFLDRQRIRNRSTWPSSTCVIAP
jgi:hypothetical protein